MSAQFRDRDRSWALSLPLGSAGAKKSVVGDRRERVSFAQAAVLQGAVPAIGVASAMNGLSYGDHPAGIRTIPGDTIFCKI